MKTVQGMTIFCTMNDWYMFKEEGKVPGAQLRPPLLLLHEDLTTPRIQGSACPEHPYFSMGAHTHRCAKSEDVISQCTHLTPPTPRRIPNFRSSLKWPKQRRKKTTLFMTQQDGVIMAHHRVSGVGMLNRGYFVHLPRRLTLNRDTGLRMPQWGQSCHHQPVPRRPSTTTTRCRDGRRK